MSSRGRNPSRPSNTGFKVVPAHAPHSAYLGKAKKLKESLIERARIKKSFAKALKKEGLQSERLGRGQDSGPAQGYGGNGHSRGSSLNSRGRGSGRGGGNVGGRPGGGKGGSRSSVIKQDGIRKLVQLSRKTKPNADPSTRSAATESTATKTPAPKRTVVPESESDESELESGEERAPRPSKTQSRNTAPNADDDEEDDGFFDDDDVEGDMIDSRVSLRGNKGKGKGRADRVDQDGAMSMSEDEDEGNNVKRSRERSRAGPPPGDDDQDEDDEEVFLPYTNSNSNPSLRGRPGSTRGASTSTSSRGRNHLQGSNRGARPTSSSSTSTPVYGAGRPRPWGTDGVASMSHPGSGSGSMGTVTRPKGKKDKGNPNFTFLGRMGDDNGDSRDREGRMGVRAGRTEGGQQEVPPKAVVVNNTPFRGKPLHSHKPPGSTPSSTHPNSTTTTTTDNNNNNSRSTLTLRDLKRTAYLGPAKTSSSASSAFGAVHPGRTKRTLQKQQQHQQPGGRAGVVGGRRNASGGARQPRLGARMGALLQEIERRG
ncbi:hypothetical protein FFLO_03400 [Filobasidium floriforme]|uniref:Uncharacterized protein n=1 Tax=Filobasidium floriforme TaxID=5210 RepID=A0A8K0JKU0_9TREE|nr:hypothetical protein FFLO_03400 [Filobasidium floriforme]